ncbi:unnamed protein product [marine sediment metagenome]|uniref:Peptidase M20 dimerisation domain-containing protein n=1 Tax=marine sediment metagenome TaxID=412755 RepID=X1DLX5_9ZZZZ
MFRQAIKWVKANQDLLIDVSDQIWGFAELGLKEFKSSKLLAKTLDEAGFALKMGVADMPTAFYADYGEGKPVIGILGEYDALPGLSQKAQPFREVLLEDAPGHGCGHNLLGVEKVMYVGKCIGFFGFKLFISSFSFFIIIVPDPNFKNAIDFNALIKSMSL